MSTFSDIGRSPARPFGGALSPAELALITQIQSRANFSSGGLRTGRITVSELMASSGGGKKEEEKEDGGSAEGGRMALSWGGSSRMVRSPPSVFPVNRGGPLLENPIWNGASMQAPFSPIGALENRRPFAPFSPFQRFQPPPLPLYNDGYQRRLRPIHSPSSGGAPDKGFINAQNASRSDAGFHSGSSPLSMGQRTSPGHPNTTIYAGTGDGPSDLRPEFMRMYQRCPRPCFSSYFTLEAVNRGLAAGELIQGVMHASKYNSYEYYVDGDGCTDDDIAIVGARDRNRALDGDLVVVRLKQRCFWIVRDVLLEAWQGGYLGVTVDEDGSPISVPPLTVTSEYVFAELQNSSSGRNARQQTRFYGRDELICLAFAMEMQKRYSARKLPSKTFDTVKKLGIERPAGSPNLMSQLSGILTDAVTVSCSAVGVREVIVGNASLRRSGFRLLSSLAEDDWGIPDICLQRTGEVVYIVEQRNSRITVGTLKPRADCSHRWAFLSSEDVRKARMMIPAVQCPAGFFASPARFSTLLYAARVHEWHETARNPRGHLYRSLGVAGELDVETEGLLLMHDVDTREFSATVLSSLPISDSVQWHIDEHEFKYRRDFRDELVFTVNDNGKTGDLDGALHIKPIEDCDGSGSHGFEVGLHIADVSYFVKHGTELDQWTAARATSVRLVRKLIPMLPRVLREQVCSLVPGEDRLTVSVVWKVNIDGEPLDVWLGRSVIRSSCALSYEHAQSFIEHPEKKIEENDFPQVFNGRHLTDLRNAVVVLYKIAKRLRAKRFERGCLDITPDKLHFDFVDDGGHPSAVITRQPTVGEQLFEEFKLMANTAVARRIESAFPTTALLRRHLPPKSKILLNITQQCRKAGFKLRGTSCAELAESLRAFNGDSDAHKIARRVLGHMLGRAMQEAVYVASGSANGDKQQLAHFALNEPLYTHFTSPISRYSDIMVHRQLTAALGLSPALGLSTKEMESIAAHCTEKTAAAKALLESSNQMFIDFFLKAHGPVNERAMVVNVLNHSFDVFFLNFGFVKRIAFRDLELPMQPVFVERPQPELLIFWEPESHRSAPIEQIIRPFSIVQLELFVPSNSVKCQVSLKKPSGAQMSVANLLTDIDS